MSNAVSELPHDATYSDHSLTTASTSTDGKIENSSDLYVDNQKERAWEPIRSDLYTTERTKSRGSSRPHSLRSLGRSRSQNGYSVGDDHSVNGEEAGDAEAGNAEKDAFEVGWEGGESDPLNPRSKSKAAKWAIVIICAICSLCVTCVSSIYTSTYGQITAEFGCSQIVATLGLSLYVMGLGTGPMFLAPLSEFYGRRVIYLASYTMFIVWIIPSAVAQNIQTMLIARFFDGLSGSAFLSVSGGTVGDLFNRDELQLPLMIFTAAPFIGPSIGPAIGGFINQYIDWRWTFYVCLIWAGTLLALVYFFVPETYHPVLLKRKAQNLRKETGDERWKAPMEILDKSIVRTVLTSLKRPFQLLVFEPMVLNLCLYSAILLGILYLFFGAFSLVFRENHAFTLSQVGLTFLGILVGMVCGILCDPFFRSYYLKLVAQREANGGEPGGAEPEYRLPPLIVGAPLVTIGLFFFGWTTYSSIHWIVPIIASSIFGMGTVLSFTGIFTFLVDAYPLYAASALAANSFARSAFAAAFPLFGIQMYEKLGDQWATSLLAFLTLAMLPFPYIFFKHGKRIRGRSRFATNK